MTKTRKITISGTNNRIAPDTPNDSTRVDTYVVGGPFLKIEDFLNRPSTLHRLSGDAEGSLTGLRPTSFSLSSLSSPSFSTENIPKPNFSPIYKPEIYDDNDDYSIKPLSEDRDNPMPDSYEVHPPENVVIIKKDIVKRNTIWVILRTNLVNLSKQIYKTIYNRIITRNSEKYLDIKNIRSPSWELYTRKNKQHRIPSKCSGELLHNYISV